MFDTMTMTKIVGAFCGALLIFLLSNWAAELIYEVGAGEHGEAEPAYVIDTGADEPAAAETVAEAGPAFDVVYASADAANGEGLFKGCKACHKLEDGANSTGPHLFGVVGRAVGSVEGYNYSGNLTKVADVWTPENLNGFIENPKGFAPGTKMGYRGMSDIGDRADLIAYLATIGG